MTVEAKQVKVPAKLDDSTGPKTQAEYWMMAAKYSCNIGDSVLVELDQLHNDSIDQRVNNGIVHYNANGQALKTENGRWIIHKQPEQTDRGYLAPGLPAHAIIGMFENGEPFLVGERWEGEATSNNFYLALNDRLGAFHNNSGEIDYLVYSGTGIHTDSKDLDPKVGWQSFGEFRNGQRLEIMAEGWVTVGYGMTFSPGGHRQLRYDHENRQWVTQDPKSLSGPSFLCSNLTQHALVGRIGPNGTPFLVGEHHVLDFAVDGAEKATLWLSVNDTNNAFSNNHGTWHVTIVH